MLRSIAGALAAPRGALRAVRLPVPSTSSLPRFLSSTPYRNNDQSASSSQQQTADASDDATSIKFDTPATTSATSSLDDILGAVSAVALPGSSATAEADQRSEFRSRGPLIRESRYSHQGSDAMTHKLFIRASRNNTIITFTSPTGDTLITSSSGCVGFKHSGRSGYESGYRAAFAVFDKVTKFQDAWRITNIEIFWNGFGKGREAVFRALLSENGSSMRKLVSRMTDKTPIKVGGVRPKKRRIL